MVKSVTVPGKCYAISDSDRQDDPFTDIVQYIILYVKQSLTCFVLKQI
jgi:hypothetical protein